MFTNDVPLFITLNKVRGRSSAFELNRLKRILKIKKAGYCGTLDPIAEGVLVIACGKATKLISKITDSDKHYSGTMKLGVTSPSYDTETEMTPSGIVPELTSEQLREIEKSFSGMIKQRPPVFSALKVNGRRSCDLARKGIESELPERTVTVHSIKLDITDNDLITFSIECSKGTYIRSIVNDIGRVLNCGAVMQSLRRERVGIFSIERSVTISELSENPDTVEKAVMTADEFLSQFPDPENKNE